MEHARRCIVDRALLARRRWSRAEAEAILEDAESLGESLNAYGRRRGIDPQRLYRWKREMPTTTASSVAPLRTAFLPVRVTPEGDGIPAVGARPAFEVVVHGNRVVRVTEGFDASTLVRLLAALEEGT